jgi:NitT/TauT family transport system permease protein
MLVNMPSNFFTRYASALAFVAALLVWEVACRTFKVPPFVLPSPSAILGSTADLGVLRWLEHLFATLEVALLGFALAILLALTLAVAITRSVALSRIVLPWLIVIQSTPIVAIAPIIVVTLGAGMFPRIVITMMISFFPLVIATATGLSSAPPELIELSRSLRATQSREYWQIRLPFAVPYIFSGLKVGITLAVIGAVVAEFVAAEKGLGYLILFTTSTFKIPMAFAALSLLVTSSLTLYALIVWLHRRFFPWSLHAT